MNKTQFKELMKEAFREVIREELMNAGRERINESLQIGRGHVSGNDWPSINFTSDHAMNKIGSNMIPATPSPTKGKSSISDILAQTAKELYNNPAEIAHLKNI
jgi:hypothetical protein